MSRSVAMEMDLRLEAAALSEMAENTRDDPDFRVPMVDWDRTTHNVLTHGMDRRHRAERPCASASNRRSICPNSGAR